jgi:hypothetical protein
MSAGGSRTQRRLRTAAFYGRPRGLVLDGREHGGRLMLDRPPGTADDWLMLTTACGRPEISISRATDGSAP